MAVAKTKPTSKPEAKPAPKPAAKSQAHRAPVLQGTGAFRLSRDAADPPLRGEGRADVRHGADRRLLPPLHRPGSRRRRHADGAQAGRRGHHRLSRPRPHARLRHGPEGRDGGTHRPRAAAIPTARAARCTCSRSRRASTAATASSARRSRSAPGSPSPTATARTTMSASPISATAPPTRARSTRASTWRSCGSSRWSTSSRTTATPWARRSRARRRPRTCPSAGCRSTFRASRSTAWTCAP